MIKSKIMRRSGGSSSEWITDAVERVPTGEGGAHGRGGDPRCAARGASVPSEAPGGPLDRPSVLTGGLC
jgi:hypothetical protein